MKLDGKYKDTQRKGNSATRILRWFGYAPSTAQVVAETKKKYSGDDLKDIESLDLVELPTIFKQGQDDWQFIKKDRYKRISIVSRLSSVFYALAFLLLLTDFPMVSTAKVLLFVSTIPVWIMSNYYFSVEVSREVYELQPK